MSIQAHPVFGQPGEPWSPKRLALADAQARHGAEPTSPPAILHMVTNEPLAGPFELLWARGDRLAWALDRLAALPADPARHERTTTVPLLDDLAPKLGIETAFALASQVRAGNVRCRALLLQEGVVPERARPCLERRYPAHRRRRPSPRAAAAASAIRWLADEGADLDEIALVDEPVTADGRDEQAIRIDFNPFAIHLAGSGRFPSGFRLVHVWPSRARGPWLAFELVVVDQAAAVDLYDSINGGGTPADRAARLLRVLGDAG